MKFENFRCLIQPAEGKGLIGCMLLIVLVGVAIYLGIVLTPIYYSNFNFDSAVKTEVSRAGAHFFDDETLTKNILDIARRNEIRITRENIAIDRFAGQVHVNVQYAVRVDFILFERDLTFKVNASSFIGSL